MASHCYLIGPSGECFIEFLVQNYANEESVNSKEVVRPSGVHYSFLYKKLELVLWPFLLKMIIPRLYTGAVATGANSVACNYGVGPWISVKLLVFLHDVSLKTCRRWKKHSFISLGKVHVSLLWFKYLLTLRRLMFTPRLKFALARVLPHLGNVKNFNRPIFANVFTEFKCWCNACWQYSVDYPFFSY